jgi:hypothetical protein
MTAKTSKTAATAKGAPAPARVAPVDKTRQLQVIRDPSKTEDRQFADLVSDGLASNASTAIRFIKQEQGDVSLTELVASLRDQGAAVNRGDLAAAERMLSAQAVALNAVFAEMARRAALNMGEHLGATESYMRLALKAQSQSRATVETLAAIKNPPVVFARQANINNGGQQQVNNGAAPDHASNSAQARACASAHAAKAPIEQTELLEASDGQRLDARATGAPSGADPHLATLARIDRPAHR